MVTLDIISDPICPWCYIGKVRLDQAIAATGRNPFVASWRMFRLNPDMPPEGMDRQEYLEKKFGGAERAAEVYDRVRREAEAAGLDLRFDRVARTPATLDAHRLIRWARSTGAQEAVVSELFHRYFEAGEDISEHAVLLDVAETAGMEREVVERLLAGDADRAELEAEEQAARQMGVTGVPCFLIGGRYVVQGAQPVETWMNIIQEIDQALRVQAQLEDDTA